MGLGEHHVPSFNTDIRPIAILERFNPLPPPVSAERPGRFSPFLFRTVIRLDLGHLRVGRNYHRVSAVSAAAAIASPPNNLFLPNWAQHCHLLSSNYKHGD